MELLTYPHKTHADFHLSPFITQPDVNVPPPLSFVYVSCNPRILLPWLGYYSDRVLH